MSENNNAQGGLFDRVEPREYGYNMEEVEEFLAFARNAYNGSGRDQLSVEDVQQANFEVVFGGYDPAAVDSALDRLEDAIILKRRNEHIASEGEKAWYDHLEKRTEVLMGRLQRPAGERFRRPINPKAQGYRAEDVDSFLNRLRAFLTEDQALRVSEIREATFSSAVGDAAYDELQVDRFLNRFVELTASIQ